MLNIEVTKSAVHFSVVVELVNSCLSKMREAWGWGRGKTARTVDDHLAVGWAGNLDPLCTRSTIQTSAFTSDPVWTTVWTLVASKVDRATVELDAR